MISTREIWFGLGFGSVHILKDSGNDIFPEKQLEQQGK